MAELRQALTCAVAELRTGNPQDTQRLESHLDSARELGWKPSDDSHDDMWGTARAITNLTGSIKQFPVNAFLQREVERNTTSSV